MRVQPSPAPTAITDFSAALYDVPPRPAGRSRHLTVLAMIVTLAITDLAMVTLALAMSYEVRFQTSLIPVMESHQWSDYFGPALAQCLVVPAVFLWQGMYHFRRNISRIDEFQRVFAAVSIATVITWAASAYLIRDLNFSRAVMALAWPLEVALVWSGRVVAYFLFSLLLRRGVAQEHVLIVGSGDMARFIIQKIQEAPAWGYRTVGVATLSDAEYDAVEAAPVLGGAGDLERLIHDYAIT
ncbi:MAG: hypothetical protein NTZ05_06010, partial [Chloroflexi bacterium]|nr:hypothetical protein [Chloroflexota bacterium]